MVFFALILGLGLILGELPNLFAQESAKDEFTLEEITVTAQKRAENQQKVAISMEVISGDTLKEVGKNDLNQILENVSSIVVNKTGQSLRVSLRGVSDDKPEGAVQMSTPAVAVNTDGIMTNRQKSGTSLFDIERVEVLYGPQSTLYASSTPGGIVNVISASPKLDTYSASGTVEYGNYSLLHTEGAMNVPIGGKVALRAAFSTSVRDGYLSNGGDDDDTKSVRLKTLFQPSDKLSFQITGELSKINNHGFGNVKIFNNQSDKYYPDGTKMTTPWTASQDAAGDSRAITEKKIYGTLNLSTGFANIALTPSYSSSSQPDTTATQTQPFPPFATETHFKKSERWEKSAELRLTSPDDFLFKWIAGYVWYHSLDDSKDQTVGVSNHRNQYNEQVTKAFYGNITYPFTEQFRVTGGARLSNDTNDSINNEFPPGPGKAAVEETHMKYNNPDYKIGIEYDLGTNAMLFSDYSTSYRAQGMLFDESGNQFPPEKLKAYTLGIKSRLMQNKLQINASTFYYDYQNFAAVSGYQYMVFNDYNGDGVYSNDPIEWPVGSGQMVREKDAARDENAKTYGNYKEYGLDLQMNAILTDKDRLDLSVSYLNDEFTKLYFDLLQVTNDQGIPDQNYKGKGAPYTPDWSITASFDHRFDLPNGGSITARVDGRWKSDFIVSFVEYEMEMNTTASTGPDHVVTSIVDMSKTRYQESFITGNLSATYTNSNGKFSLTGYVKNLTNYAEKRSLVMGGREMEISSPRTYGAVLSVKY